MAAALPLSYATGAESFDPSVQSATGHPLVFIVKQWRRKLQLRRGPPEFSRPSLRFSRRILTTVTRHPSPTSLSAHVRSASAGDPKVLPSSVQTAEPRCAISSLASGSSPSRRFVPGTTKTYSPLPFHTRNYVTIRSPNNSND
jgi:hypothetical protein